jgi:hydroxymethylpyrimidine/phosphomethylpyrimidine kinase
MARRDLMLKELMNEGCSMSIAGVDPSGGAGIIADIKTFHAHSIYATGVVTAITAQNPFEVNAIQKIDVYVIASQIDTVLDIYPIEYIKTGMLYDRSIVRMVSDKIREYQLKAVVDPVMISESGKNLTMDDFAMYMNRYLVKKSFLITPNIHEAEQLSNMKIEDEEDMIKVAEKLRYDNNVVITGGHLNGNDILVEDGNVHIIKGNLIDSYNTHGTGCTYSSAITSNLIKQETLKDSCIKANKFIQEAIRHGFNKAPYQFYEKY